VNSVIQFCKWQSCELVKKINPRLFRTVSDPRRAICPSPSYPAGSVLSLVTWTQTEDTRWFGARIPSQVKSAEFVIVTGATEGQRSYSYEEYEGTPLKKSSSQDGATPTQRAAYLLSQRAAVMP
jgi:hypothetical protein